MKTWLWSCPASKRLDYTFFPTKGAGRVSGGALKGNFEDARRLTLFGDESWRNAENGQDLMKKGAGGKILSLIWHLLIFLEMILKMMNRRRNG